MALIDSLKAFYKDSVEDINKLNDADSVLEVLRAKYGDYKGANVEEFFKELIANDVKPSSGGGSYDIPEFTFAGDGKLFSWSCNTTYDALASMIALSEYQTVFDDISYSTSPVAVIYANEAKPTTLFQNATVMHDAGGDYIDAGSVCYYPDGTIMEM